MVSAFFTTHAPKAWATATATAATTAMAALLVWTAPLPAHAQAEPAAATAAPAEQDFPADAQMLSASELDARLRGKVYTATTASGLRWRADYKASGYVFFNLGNGKDTGSWRTEDGKVCVDYRSPIRSNCTEIRGKAQQTLYAKNSTTGVVTVITTAD